MQCITAIPRQPPPEAIRVVAPARLHMGFLDISATLGRRYGGIGMGVEAIATTLCLRRSDGPSAHGPGADRALHCLLRYCETEGLSPDVHVEVQSAIPEHVGLGSGTQMALAIGVGVARLHGLPADARTVACRLQRGLRSGIGVGVFEQGGFIVDGGRGMHTRTPPLLARLALPAAWRLILVFDEHGQGLHGQDERVAFEELPPFPRSAAADLCHALLLQGLPALAEGDLAGFGEVINRLQKTVGDHFAPVQGGRYTSAVVAEAMAWLQHHGATAVGQSSWGPTGFCMTADVDTAERLAHQARVAFAGCSALRFLVTAPRNEPARLEAMPAAELASLAG